MAKNIVVYGHPMCPGVGPVKGLLTQVRAEFEYVDIRQDSAAAELVRALNNGSESVPTLVFPDGSSLTEPSVSALTTKLESLGYRVGPIAWLIGNAWLIATVAVVVFAILRFVGVI